MPPEVSSFVPAPYQGISQAPPQVRLLESAEDLRNCVVDLPDGWRKRPPLRWTAELLSSGGTSGAKAFEIIDPDTGAELHLLVNREGSSTVVHLFDATWSPVSITIDSAAQTYLNNATDLKHHLRLSQAVDYTIFTCRNVKVGVDPTPNATRPYEALFFVKSGAYGKTYQFSISGIVGSYTTPNGGAAGDANMVDTDRVIDYVFGSNTTPYDHNGFAFTKITTVLAANSFTIMLSGAVVYLSRLSDFDVTVQDGQGGTAAVAIKQQVNSVADLPKICPVVGFTVKVRPTRGDDLGAYWLRYDGNGTWKECLAPGAQLGFEPTTMPVGLIKESSGTWHLKALPWKQRTVGDETTCIDPGFVGDYIQDIKYVDGRLTIISSEEVFQCAADDPFRVYPATLTTVIDSDPISHTPPLGKAQFIAGVAFEKSLAVIGLKYQAVLRTLGEGPSTGQSTRLQTLSKYSLESFGTGYPLVPCGVASKVYLPEPRGRSYVGIRELKIDRVSGEDTSDDLTPALPRLLPSTIDIVASIETLYEAIYGVSGSAIDLYFHSFRYVNNERVQNGISSWFLPEGWTLVDITAVGTTFYFYLLYTSTGRLCVFSMEMNPKTLDASSNGTAAVVLTKLDCRQYESQVVSRTYSSSAGTTSIVARVPLPVGLGYVCARVNDAEQNYPEGYLANVVSQSGSTIVVKGNWTAPQHFYVGINYEATWRLSRIYMTSGKDQRVLANGRLQIQELKLSVSEAGGLHTSVSVANRSTRNYFFSQTKIGTPSGWTGEWRIPVKGEAGRLVINIIDDTPWGGSVSGFEWAGNFTPTTRRVS